MGGKCRVGSPPAKSGVQGPGGTAGRRLGMRGIRGITDQIHQQRQADERPTSFSCNSRAPSLRSPLQRRASSGPQHTIYPGCNSASDVPELHGEVRVAHLPGPGIKAQHGCGRFSPGAQEGLHGASNDFTFSRADARSQ